MTFIPCHAAAAHLPSSRCGLRQPEPHTPTTHRMGEASGDGTRGPNRIALGAWSGEDVLRGGTRCERHQEGSRPDRWNPPS